MTRSADTEQFVDECIGPRHVGGRYYTHQGGDEYTVLGIDRNPQHDLWSITEATDAEAARGVSRTHCTPWHHRDRVVSQPTGVA